MVHSVPLQKHLLSCSGTPLATLASALGSRQRRPRLALCARGVRRAPIGCLPGSGFSPRWGPHHAACSPGGGACQDPLPSGVPHAPGGRALGDCCATPASPTQSRRCSSLSVVTGRCMQGTGCPRFLGPHSWEARRLWHSRHLASALCLAQENKGEADVKTLNRPNKVPVCALLWGRWQFSAAPRP